MNRAQLLQRLHHREQPWDLIVIGGGASGAGITVDAAARGYDVLLLEQADFGKGTSSRSTKLIHGGVRYLQQGDFGLVKTALRERKLLRQNAPHVVRKLDFLIPTYAWWEKPYYGLGLKLYDLLAGRHTCGRSTALSVEETAARLPTLETDGLRGAIQYGDAQFDDSRLLINLIQTAYQQGATPLNYCRVTGLIRDRAQRVCGVTALDGETGETLEAEARCVINAAGPFIDQVRDLDSPKRPRMLALSQGIHLVLDESFLPGSTAMILPRTSDGRLMFAIPWKGRVLLGTTDTCIQEADLEPQARREEVALILETAGRYLRPAPREEDVLSVFAGIRPLVKSDEYDGNTAELSREHRLNVTESGLLTVAGGKWTTYRAIAEECVDRAVELANLDPRPCVTRDLKLHGYHQDADKFSELAIYGGDAFHLHDLMRQQPDTAQTMHERLDITAAQVLWAVRAEMARTVEDILARRVAALAVDAQAAVDVAPKVARLMAKELQQDDAWQQKQVEAFTTLAKSYQITW